MTEPAAEIWGNLIKRYREVDLQLSQADLAWLADVSRGTISNIETGRVNSDERTLHRVRTALGLAKWPAEGFGLNEAVQPILPTIAIQGLIDAILAIREESTSRGTRVAVRWRSLVATLTQDGMLDSKVEPELGWLAREVAIKATPEKAQIILSALQELGWAPRPAPASEDSDGTTSEVPDLRLLTRVVSSLSLQISNFREEVRGFDRLPIRVQELLSHGLIVDYEIERDSASPGVSVIDLVVVDEKNSPLIPRREIIGATNRWSNILMIARYISERLAPDKDADEILSALERVFEAEDAKD